MHSRISQGLIEIKNMMNPVVASQLLALLTAAACFYASNVIMLTSPSILLFTLPVHPVAVFLLKPQLKVTQFGVHLTINGNFWIPLAVDPTVPYALFAAGSAAFALALALDIHPDTAPNWYGILKAKHEVGEIRKALKAITLNMPIIALLATLQASAFILTVVSFYHYAVNYIVNGGLQWEILAGGTIISPAITVVLATLAVLATKAITYKKLKFTLSNSTHHNEQTPT